jgi:hypothetical protein
MINEDNRYIFTRAELKERAASEFNHGDLVICGKYYIHIKYKKHNDDEQNMPVSFFTNVNTRYDLRDLPMHKHPYYIREFIECYATYK